MAAKMAEKKKACQNESTNISIDDEFQNILVKNQRNIEQEVSTGKSVKSNHEMEKDLQTLITDFVFFKIYVLEVFTSSIETNQSNDLRDTKYLHNIISYL